MNILANGAALAIMAAMFLIGVSLFLGIIALIAFGIKRWLEMMKRRDEEHQTSQTDKPPPT